jgi:hypothetical protein
MGRSMLRPYKDGKSRKAGLKLGPYKDTIQGHRFKNTNSKQKVKSRRSRV